jgi:glycosyltransferase involved in cell wall biosynthesis
MDQLSSVSVVLPSLDPDEKLHGVIQGLLSEGFDDIILVNDGSKPENLHYFEEAALLPQVHVLHHPQNRGKGAALKTAFRYFLENRRERAGVVTVDGDGQHHSADTAACARQMLECGKIILGVRDFSLPSVPWRSRCGNRITSLVFKIFVGMTISDTQTGLRAIPKARLEQLCRVEGDRFEYETNMLLAMKTQKLSFDEVKIRTVYIEENKSSHFRTVRDSWRIYKLILAHFFRYIFSSLASFAVDEGLFVLLSAVFGRFLTGFALTAVPASVARLISSALNFAMNKRLVFKSKGGTVRALVRYYLLAVPMAVGQILLTHGVYALLQIGSEQILLRAVIHAVVMTVLFVASFLLQQHWVFGKQGERT